MFSKDIHFLEQYPALQTLLCIIFLILASYIANFICRHILLRVVYKVLSVIDPKGQSEYVRTAVGYLANIVPTLVVYHGIAAVPHLPAKLVIFVQNVSNAFTVFVVTLAISAMLSFAENFYFIHRGKVKNRSIKGLVQVIKIVLFVFSFILIIATLMDKSPWVVFSGLGALAAVIMLISQNTLLSFVAGIQIQATDMVRMGDWITMPSMNADGDVVDMALHTVKVRNFDNTITTIPTQKLVTESFINWRGMRESGGRRIRRALYIDQMSIRFLTDEDYEKLSQYRALRRYMRKKKQELEAWNTNLEKNPNMVGAARRLTNIGTFRAYVVEYLENNPFIRKDMTLLVRQLDPTSTGLPLQIYCFANTVKWVDYEGIQSDIFDHLYSIIPAFGLRVFQESSGNFTELVMNKPLPVVEMPQADIKEVQTQDDVLARRADPAIPTVQPTVLPTEAEKIEIEKKKEPEGKADNKPTANPSPNETKTADTSGKPAEKAQADS